MRTLRSANRFARPHSYIAVIQPGVGRNPAAADNQETMHPAVACALLLAVHLHSGTTLSEHASFDDRVAWVLPPDRLAAFERSGVVIDEDQRTTIVAHLTASVDPRGMTTFRGSYFKRSTDVPRRRSHDSLDDRAETVTPRNDPLPARTLDIENAAMASLPEDRLCIGQSWDTHLPVMTTLGSGVASIHHTVVGVNHGIAEIDVRGTGVISGVEYNLPRLLPGTIAIQGTAWFEMDSGYLRQESYLVENRLIRTVKGKTIGFVERETVDATDRANLPAPSR